MLLLAGRRSGDAHNRVPKKKRLNAEPCHHAVTTNQEKDRTYGRVASVSYTSSCHNFEHTSIVLGALPPRRHHNFKRIDLVSVQEEHIFFFSPLHFEEIKYILATQPSPKKKKISVARVPWSSLTRRVHHNHHHHHYHQVPHVKSTRQSVAMANNAAQETSKRTPTVEQQKQQQQHPTKKQRQQQQDGGRPDNNNSNSNNNMPPRRLYWVGNPLFALTPVLLSSSSTPSTSSSSTSSTPSSSTSTKGTHDQPRQLPPLPPASLPFASSSSIHKNHHNQNEKNGGYQAEREEEQQEEEEEKKRKEKTLWDHRGAKMRKPSLGSEMGKNRENGGGGGGGTAAATATARKDVKM